MQGIVKGFKYTDTFKLNSKVILKGVGCLSPILERRLRRVDRDTLGPPEPWPITWQAPHSRHLLQISRGQSTVCSILSGTELEAA